MLDYTKHDIRYAKSKVMRYHRAAYDKALQKLLSNLTSTTEDVRANDQAELIFHNVIIDAFSNNENVYLKFTDYEIKEEMVCDRFLELMEQLLRRVIQISMRSEDQYQRTVNMRILQKIEKYMRNLDD